MIKRTVTIGIPAFNEGRSIQRLLNNLLEQKRKSFLLEKIIVVSDASTDNTIEEVKKIRNKKIVLLYNKIRKGKAYGLNKIIKETTSDVLILLDADIYVKDTLFIEKIIKPIVRNHADLTSATLLPVLQKTRIGKIINASIEYKEKIFKAYKNGNNIYTCHGAGRALSKALYKKLHFPFDIGEDAYSYLFCIKNGYQYKYAASAEIYFKVPDSFHDHQKQSIRFFNSQKKLAKIFGGDFTHNQYRIPFFPAFYLAFKLLIKDPQQLIGYLSIYFFLKIKSLYSGVPHIKWDISESTKIMALDSKL